MDHQGQAHSAGVEVRAAAPDHAAALRSVHAATWKATYVGKVPDSVAEAGLARVRARDWAEHLVARIDAGGGLLVLIVDREVVGFCEYGPTEDLDDDPRVVGQIMRLYVHPAHQTAGGGRLLVDTACRYLASCGHREATLWTLADASNLAHGFYAHVGWTCDGTLNTEQPPDVRYRRGLT